MGALIMACIFRQTFRETIWGHMHLQFNLNVLSLDNKETGALLLLARFQQNNCYIT